MAALRQSEGEAQEASVMVEIMCKEDAEDGRFMYLKSTTANFHSDPTVQRFREKGNTTNTDLVTSFMNGFRDLLAQVHSAPTDLFSWGESTVKFWRKEVPTGGR